MAMCHDTPDENESDDSASPSTHQNRSTLGVDLSGQGPSPDRQKEIERVSSIHLPHSLGMDPAFVSVLDPPFDPQQITGSAMDVNRPRVVARGHWAAKTEEADPDSWSRIVVEGSDPPPALFNASSSGLDLPDLVSHERSSKDDQSCGL